MFQKWGEKLDIYSVSLIENQFLFCAVVCNVSNNESSFVSCVLTISNTILFCCFLVLFLFYFIIIFYFFFSVICWRYICCLLLLVSHFMHETCIFIYSIHIYIYIQQYMLRVVVYLAVLDRRNWSWTEILYFAGIFLYWFSVTIQLAFESV